MSQIIYSAGYTGEGRLGRRANSNQMEKLMVQFPPISMFACGWKHNIFITKEHQVYVCGENTEGQLGPGLGACLEPVLSESLSKLNPIWVSCGDNITALLTESGSVFVFGNEWGPEPVELFATSDKLFADQTKFIFVTCGVDNVCAVCSKGKLYVWYKKLQIAKLYDCHDVLCDVAAGKHQIFGLATNGNLWVVGHSKACGMGRKWSSLNLQKVNVGNGVQIKRIFAHSAMSVAIDVEGKVYVCGSNNYGELGIPSVRKANTFQHLTCLDGKPIFLATMGDTFAAYITEKFELYTCGDGDEYRLCNKKIDKVTTPSRATAAEGHKIVWASAGCSHIIIAEGLEDVPTHPGREYFKLDGTMKLRKKKYTPFLVDITINDQKIPVDITDRGLAWSGFLPGDEVTYEEKKCIMVGCTPSGVVMKTGDSHIMYNIISLSDMHEKIRINHRNYASLKQVHTRSGLYIYVDTSFNACSAFGFAPSDIVEDMFGFSAIVVGVFGGSLWFKYEEDDGIVTLSSCDPITIHEHMVITKPYKRSIKYNCIEGHNLPIELSPCILLKEFDIVVGDLVSYNPDVGVVYGTFQHYVIVRHMMDNELSRVFPSEIQVLRRFSSQPKYVTFLSLTGKHVTLNVSCDADYEYMPFDRVMTAKGCVNIAGMNSNGLWWVIPDDAAALGAGIAYTSKPFERLLRRVTNTRTIINGVDVSTGSMNDCGLLPADVIIYDGKKYTVEGSSNGEAILSSDSKITEVDFESLKNSAIVFRADLPATRIYITKNGNGMIISVSSSDFVGLRFLPDDVIKTPKGIGVVVGVSGSDICIHLNETRGVTFFSISDIYNINDFSLMERRAVRSVIKIKEKSI